MDHDPFFDMTPDIPTPVDTAGKNAKILGIVSLIVSACCCGLIGIVLAILSLYFASQSKRLLGTVTNDAETGKILSIISLVIAGLGVLGYILYFAMIIITGFLVQ